jgi:hypothetical protein
MNARGLSEVGNVAVVNRIQLLHELLFSFYFPFLLVSAHERGPGGAWAVKVVHWAVSHGYLGENVGIEDERIFFADFILLWASVVFVFFLLRVKAFRPVSRIVLRFLAGATALLGYPLVAVYTRRDLMLFVYAELVIATICLLLWMFTRWHVSMHINIILLLLHFIFWSTFGGGPSLTQAAWTAIWPPLYLRPGLMGLLGHSWLCYPLLGFLSTLIWAMQFRKSANSVTRDCIAA